MCIYATCASTQSIVGQAGIQARSNIQNQGGLYEAFCKAEYRHDTGGAAPGARAHAALNLHLSSITLGAGAPQWEFPSLLQPPARAGPWPGHSASERYPLRCSIAAGRQLQRTWSSVDGATRDIAYRAKDTRDECA